MITEKEHRIVRHLLKQASIRSDTRPECRADRFKIAAGVVLKSTLISTGSNQMKSHPLQQRFGKNEHSRFLHAEIDAIKNALNYIDIDDFSRSTLVVVRCKFVESMSTVLVSGLARPCDGCWEAIRHFKIKKVIWTTDATNEYGVYRR